MNASYKHADITEKIIKAFYKVYNKLGFGFLEKVYEKALIIELSKLELSVASQQIVKVYYEGHEIGFYIADLVVSSKVVVELKAAECLAEEHEAQLVNYLRATNIEVGLLLNFGKTPQLKRRVFTNDYKNQ